MNNNSLVLRVVAVVGALVLVVGIFWIKNRNSAEKKDANRGGSSFRLSEHDNWEIDADAFYKDSDNDGLYDWEESLWGTDPFDPDTDGDGTPDGEEIKLGRDPRIPGPDDKLLQENMPIYKREDKENLSVSESFQKDYFDGLLSLRQKGNVSKESLDQMLSELTSKYLKEPNVSREYSLTSIQTTPDNGNEAIKTYVNRLGKLAQDYRGVLSSEDVLGFLNVFAISKDEKVLSELASLIQTYAQAQSALLSVPVPQNLSGEHVAMLNGISTMRRSLNAVYLSAESDPLASILELSSFRAGLLLFATAVEDIKMTTTAAQIQFSGEEFGRLFLNL